MTLEKTYQPQNIEKKWYQQWENAGYFSPKASPVPYCIMLPPPNVTGTLHMGHAFQDTIMDTLIRYHRMKGNETLWQGGTDHAGIATQMVVERNLQREGLTRHQLGREAFIEKVWEWKHESGNTISQQMRRLGASIDWSRECFTMDDNLSETVREVFVRMYDEGLIYRGKRLVNWDPKLHTAISDLEVQSEEEDGFLWHIRYPLHGREEYLVVATTRPETMLGDVAVAVNPNDERYQHLIGEQVQLPLCNRLIPIIADEFVAMDFGTGCVKITPAHDFTDHEIGKKHGLAMINIFTIDAIMNTNVPSAYQGLDRFVARERIVKDLEALQLLEKIEPYKIKIPRGDRSGVVVEPYLTDQWFMNVKNLAREATAAVRTGKIEFVPEHWSKTFYEWMDNIQDWCISRQLWWGHRIPAFYDQHGEVYVGHDEASVRMKYELSNDVKLTQDNDVLDTWFSSALWPFSTLGWPNETRELKHFYPTNVLVTGFDIIFFWVARMIMMGIKLTGEVPFRQVYVHGLIQDSHGQKMSKSKGNIIDPIDLIDGIDLESLVQKRISGLMQPQMAQQIEKNTRKEYPEGIQSYGTDAVRLTFCAIATSARFIRFDLVKVEGYRNFCNKLWNATRYVLMNLDGKSMGTSNADREFTVADRWIRSLWQKTKQQVAEYMDTYRFDMVAQTLHDFTWNHFCDWYLELSKPMLSDTQPIQQQNATRYTLFEILEELMRAMHPVIPFITEEIWQMLPHGKTNTSIMIQSYPVIDKHLLDQTAELQVAWIQDFIVGVRNIRGEMNINPGLALPVFARTENAQLRQVLEQEAALVQRLAKVKAIEWLNPNQAIPPCATNVIGALEIHIPLAGFIDKAAEIKRLNKEIEKLSKEITTSEQKLANPGYVQKAPPAVVEKEREHLLQSQQARQKLNETLAQIENLTSDQ